MLLTRSRLALVAALCLTSTAAIAAGVPAPAAPAPATPVAAAPAAAAPPAAPAAAAPAAMPTGPTISMAQADAIIMQAGFTPLGQPKQKGNIIGSLARLGNNAYIVTVDATTGQFLDAKPTNVALPPLATAPAMAAPAAQAAPPMAAAPANTNESPVKRAADIARSKGYKVMSFRHASDDTFLTAKRGDAVFSLKIDDHGRILSIVPMNQARATQSQSPPASLATGTGRDRPNNNRRD